AIAAMAYGTESVPSCDKLFDPGNSYVTEAKQQVAQSGAAAIDMPAGPSEVLVIADAGAQPAFVAADLLSQAEHGPDSQVLLLSDSDAFIDAVQAQLEIQ
ncbi:histidinol dehydrogenase, partial [Xanthomonas perforans]|uniref:histidinol dehydrogenase n=1 Tax=Xanthomonas perforans TaxID=442694 RepID=UPI001F1A5A8D